MSLSLGQIKEIILESCEKRSVKLPDSFSTDWDLQFSEKDSPIQNFNQLRTSLCTKIRGILASPEYEEKYGDIAKTIIDDVRIKIAQTLNFREVMNKRGPNKPSMIETLEGFLNSLAPDETWTITKLKKWRENEDNVGRRLYFNIYKILPWNLETVRLMLEDKADSVLARNPFLKEEKNLVSAIQAKQCPLKFLASLKSGIQWSSTELNDWEDDEYTGRALVLWIWRHYGSFSLHAIHDLLGG